MEIRSELDPPFSQSGATATDWPAVQDILESAATCWLTTVRVDGRPHVTPLVAVWHGDSMYFCTGEDEQKAVNLRSNQHVALTTGCNGWQEGTDVVVEGVARQVTDDALLTELAAVWTTKWDGSWQFEVTDEGFGNTGADAQALVYAVEPRRVLAFGRRRPDGPREDTMLARVAFTHTRHLPPRD